MELTLYEQLGGDAFFERLVEAFYMAITQDELLRPMYPEDLTESKRTMTLFLIQYWGGPSTYSEERGHPRLRMRHAPFRITKKARDAWMAAMSTALEGVRDEMSSENFEEMTAYFEVAAHQMRNV